MTDPDYADDQALPQNTPFQIKSPPYCLVQATESIGLYANKKVYAK